MSTDEIRAADLQRNQFFREEGMDEIHRVDSVTSRGDTELIDCHDGCEVTIDRDTTVEVFDFAPVVMAGTLTLANDMSVHFQITDVAGTISYSQWGQPEEILYHTVPLLDGLVREINEGELLVTPHGR